MRTLIMSALGSKADIRTEDDRQLGASGFRQSFSLADRKLFKPAGELV